MSSTIVAQSSIPVRGPNFFPVATRRWRMVRKMELHCECGTITRHNPQSMKRCPVCGSPVATLHPGRPHRKPKPEVKYEIQHSTLCEGWVNTWTDDGEPTVFATKAEAARELGEFLEDRPDEDPEQYRIAAVMP
jgi:hypothetical protein